MIYSASQCDPYLRWYCSVLYCGTVQYIYSEDPSSQGPLVWKLGQGGLVFKDSTSMMKYPPPDVDQRHMFAEDIGCCLRGKVGM